MTYCGLITLISDILFIRSCNRLSADMCKYNIIAVFFFYIYVYVSIISNVFKETEDMDGCKYTYIVNHPPGR